MLALLALSHIPQWGPYAENCAEGHHRGASQSQVSYFRGSGGLEFELEADDEPVVKFDVLLRDEAAVDSFSLHVGCGRCRRVDSLPPNISVDFDHSTVEPFTQMSMISALHEDSREFNASGCSGYVTIRLEDHGTRTDGDPLVYSIVLGKDEVFSLAELLAFPVIILRLHGGDWTDLGWTWWLNLFLVAPIIWPILRLCCRLAKYDTPKQKRMWSIREIIYDVALRVYLAAAIEELLHLLVAWAASGEADMGVPVGIGVILISQVIPLLFVLALWTSIGFCGCGDIRGMLDDPFTGFFEFLIGFALLFCLGSGFYAGPVLLMAASIVRCCEPRPPNPTRPMRLQFIFVKGVDPQPPVGLPDLPDMANMPMNPVMGTPIPPSMPGKSAPPS